MKKIFSIGAFCLLTLLSACGDDNFDEENHNIGNEFDGVYKGVLDIVCEEETLAEDLKQKIYIQKVGENTFKMLLKDFSLEGLAIGDIEVSNIQVIKEKEECSFTGAQELDLTVGKCLVGVEGEIEGKELDIDIDVDLAPAGIDMNVEVEFEGVKLAADQSSEAQVLDFTFDTTVEANKIITGQPVIEGNSITFSIIDTATVEQIQALTPTISISEKATISPKGGVAADFNQPVTYVVTSEDEIKTQSYEVSIGARTNSLKYDFEAWETVKLFFDYETPSPKNVLETANQGTSFLSLYGFKGIDGNRVNTIKMEEGKVGSAAKLITFDTRSIANALVPGITSGALYMGKFNVGQAMTDRLKTTEFGVAFDQKEPLNFKGYYKYAPGSPFYDASNPDSIVEVADKTDECIIQAVLFEIESDTDILTGADINTSDKRVAVALLEDGSAKSEWTAFDLAFTLLEGKSYDPSKKYKITFSCSSSKEGDRFKGAPNSTLCLDELEITYKSHQN